MATTEDYKKYHCAKAARDVRRLAAKIYGAGLEPEMIEVLMEDLVGIIHGQRRIAIIGWPFPEDEEEVEVDFSAYADGRPVSTTVDWGDGYATVVHHPDALSNADREALLPEHWPCGHRHTHPTLEADD